MMLMTDLFASAYVPCWYLQLDELAKLALPESWRFKQTSYVTKIWTHQFWNGIFIPFIKSK